MLIPRKKFSLALTMTRTTLMAILALAGALPLAAATYTVTNTDDSGPGSLRQAILDANANPGADVIDATGVSGTITVNPANYFLVITDDVTINGPGQANLTISGGNASRIFWIQNGAITIQDLTLANGYAKGGNGGGGGMGAGGAIFMHEGKQGTNPTDVASGSINLTLINVTLKDNIAQGGNGSGGSGTRFGGGGMGGNGNTSGAAGGVLGSAGGYEYGGSVTDATVSARGTNGGIAIFGSGGKEGSPSDAGFGGGGGGDEDGGFAGGGGGGTTGAGCFGRGGFGGGGGNAGTDNNYLNNGGARGGYGGGGGGLENRGDGSQGNAGNDDGQAGFGGGDGTTIGGGGMGAGGAIFVASGTLTMKGVTFQNNTATGGTGGNDGQGLGGALFIFDKADNGGNAAPGTTNDPQVSGCHLTFSGNNASTNNNDTYGSIGFANICPLILTAEGPAGPLASGAPVTVTITADKFVNLGTLQFSVNWDPAELQLDSNIPLTIDDDAPVIGAPASGQLTYTWLDADFPDYGVTLPDGTIILTLNFTVLAAAPTTGINVDITDTPTVVEATENNFESVPVTLNNLVNFDVIAPTIKAFVFVANKVTLKSTKQSTSTGDVHSNGLLVVEKGKPSTYNSNLTAVGKITINKQNTINGDVTSAASISNSGTINGTKSVGAVDTEDLPSLSYSAGGSNKTVPKGKSLTLIPGSYGIVTMSNNGTLKLTSGEYFMNELRYSSSIEGGVIEIDLSSGDPITINVVSNLQLGHEAAIVLLPNGENDSHLVTFNTKQSTAANWGREAYLLGSFNAPNAVVTLVKNTQMRGSICAKEILVSNDCLFLHHDSPGSLPGPGNLPKTSFEDEEEVASDQSAVIRDYALEQNYPNPFNPSTVISFQLPVASEVSLSIFNMNGQLVKQVASGKYASGRHQIVWDATDDRGARVASGVYVYVIKAGPSTGSGHGSAHGSGHGSGQAFTAQKKLVLMK